MRGLDESGRGQRCEAQVVPLQLTLIYAPAYRQLLTQLCQWIEPIDQRHLGIFCENVAAILQAQSACLSHWLPYLSHRPCKARSQMERLNYFVYNPKITAETFYWPILEHFLKAWEGAAMLLTLDTSMLWDQFCLIEVCLVWGGRSIPLSQKVLDHGSATVTYDDYRPVLEALVALLPPGCTITLLADREFTHGALIRWLQLHQWSWAIRAKCDLNIELSSGRAAKVADLWPPEDEAYLWPNVTVLDNIECHLATANVSVAGESWAVLTSEVPGLKTFELYGNRFGGIEPHFKDYKSAAFDITRSNLRDAQALSCLLMTLATATIIAISMAVVVIAKGRRRQIDWHSQRGLSFLQLGLRQLQALCYQSLTIPTLAVLPRCHPPPACASLKKSEEVEMRIQFSRVTLRTK